jgi:mevalonate pyrophosphate decarboxylase
MFLLFPAHPNTAYIKYIGFWDKVKNLAVSRWG